MRTDRGSSIHLWLWIRFLDLRSAPPLPTHEKTLHRCLCTAAASQREHEQWWRVSNALTRGQQQHARLAHPEKTTDKQRRNEPIFKGKWTTPLWPAVTLSNNLFEQQKRLAGAEKSTGAEAREKMPHEEEIAPIKSRFIASALHPCAGRATSSASSIVIHERSASPVRSNRRFLKSGSRSTVASHAKDTRGWRARAALHPTFQRDAERTPSSFSLATGACPWARERRQKVKPKSAIFSSSAATISVLARRLAEEGYCVSHFAWRAIPARLICARPNAFANALTTFSPAPRSLRLAHDRSSANGAPLPLVLVAHSSEGCAAAMAAACLSLSGAKGRDLGPLAGIVACSSGLRVDDGRFLPGATP